MKRDLQNAAWSAAGVREFDDRLVMTLAIT